MKESELKKIIKQEIEHLLSERADPDASSAFFTLDNIIKNLENIENLTNGKVTRTSIQSAITALEAKREEVKPVASAMAPDDSDTEAIG